MQEIETTNDFCWYKVSAGEIQKQGDARYIDLDGTEYQIRKFYLDEPNGTYYVRSDADGYTTIHENDGVKFHGSTANRTEDFFHMVLKTGEHTKDLQAMSFLDENGYSLYETLNGCYFLFEDRGASAPKSGAGMPDYVRQSICDMMGTDPVLIYQTSKGFGHDVETIAANIEQDFRDNHTRVDASIHVAETGQDYFVHNWQDIRKPVTGQDIYNMIEQMASKSAMIREDLVNDNLDKIPFALNYADFSIGSTLYSFRTNEELFSFGEIQKESSKKTQVEYGE